MRGTYISSKSLDLTRRLFARKLCWDHRKTHLASNNDRWVNKLRSGGLFRRKTGSDRPRSVRSEEALRQVEQSTLDSPERSVRHRLQSLGLKRASLHTILREDLRLHPCRMQVRHKLTPEDESRRLNMAQWFIEHPVVLDRLWFSYEAYFWLSGRVNSRNAVHWGSNVLDKVLIQPLHSEKVTAWIGKDLEAVHNRTILLRG